MAFLYAIERLNKISYKYIQKKIYVYIRKYLSGYFLLPRVPEMQRAAISIEMRSNFKTSVTNQRKLNVWVYRSGEWVYRTLTFYMGSVLTALSIYCYSLAMAIKPVLQADERYIQPRFPVTPNTVLVKPGFSYLRCTQRERHHPFYIVQPKKRVLLAELEHQHNHGK